VLVGRAGATLLALLFVAVSLGAGYLTEERQSATRTFMSPVVIDFTSVFFLSAVALFPWHQVKFFAALRYNEYRLWFRNECLLLKLSLLPTRLFRLALGVSLTIGHQIRGLELFPRMASRRLLRKFGLHAQLGQLVRDVQSTTVPGDDNFIDISGAVRFAAMCPFYLVSCKQIPDADK
jgi:hypothetical protein